MNRLFASLALFVLATANAAGEYPAVLDWSQRAVFSTPVSGVIESVAVDPGERVAAGDTLLQLDQRPFNTALNDARAQLRKHELLREEARRELERTRELYERTVISIHDLQLGEIAFATAESDYSSAVARLNKATLEQEQSILRAPFAGMALAVHVSAGMTVINTQLATPLVTLVQDRPMHALAQVDAATLSGLAVGQAVTVKVNNSTFNGTVRLIGMEPDSNGRYTLTVAFDPGEQALRAGLAAHIEPRR
jgi:RND family efflux transporter MFP subunit